MTEAPLTKYTEAPLTTTIKGESNNDPWIVIRSENGEHLEAQLLELENGPVLVTLGRVLSTLRGKINIGRGLEAKPTEPQTTAGAFKANNFPPVAAPAATPAPAPAAARAPAAAPAAPAPAAADPWATPAQPAAPQGWGTGPADPWATPGTPAGPAAAAPQPQGLPAGPAATPGAPVILGMSARMVSGSNSRGPWHAWGDPRPQSVTEPISQETDDPNHPGLAAGTHKYWTWIR